MQILQLKLSGRWHLINRFINQHVKVKELVCYWNLRPNLISLYTWKFCLSSFDKLWIFLYIYPGLNFWDYCMIWLQAYPQEKVGVFVRRGKGGPLTVVEYNELDPTLASAINQETGRLRFCWSNVCIVPSFVDVFCLLFQVLGLCLASLS